MKRVLLLLLFSPIAFAQEPALRVMIDGLAQEAVACGIGRPALEAVAARTLKAHGVALSTDARDPYLYLNVNAYRVMQGSTVVGCTTRLGVSVRAAVAGEGAVRAFKPKGEAHVVLCESGRLLSGARREMAGAVAKAFEAEIKSCLSQLSF